MVDKVQEIKTYHNAPSS